MSFLPCKAQLSYDQTNIPKHNGDYTAKHLEQRGKELMRLAGHSIDDLSTDTPKLRGANPQPNKNTK